MESHGNLTLLESHTQQHRPAVLSTSLLDVNQRCIELLIASAQSLPAEQEATHLLGVLRSRLLSLTATGQTQVASSPFLLLSLNFHDLPWWQHVISHPQHRSPQSVWRRYFPKAAAIRLTRATLMLAWHAAHTHHEYAAVNLGIDLHIQSLISSLSLHALDQLADHHYLHLMPRWEDRPVVWKHLLDSTHPDNREPSHPFNLHGLQLIAGELLTLHGQLRRSRR